MPIVRNGIKIHDGTTRTGSIIKKSDAQKIKNYIPAGKIAADFIRSRNKINLIMGPVGSGKSVACCMFIYKTTLERPRDKFGYKTSKWLVVRNSQPDLERTTLPTWLTWFIPQEYGGVTKQPYVNHFAIDEHHKLQMEILFVSLNDVLNDISKLKSLELTGVWFNEGQYIKYQFFTEALQRVGRFPSVSDMPNSPEDDFMATRHQEAKEAKDTEEMNRILKEWIPWAGIISDSNPPEFRTHWFARLMQNNLEGSAINPKITEVLSTFKQPSALEPDAENLANLPGDYYETILNSAPEGEIRRNVHGEIGKGDERDGVYENEWRDMHEASSFLTPDVYTPVYVGLDFGHTPAAVFVQKDKYGKYYVLTEIVNHRDDKTDIQTFAEQIHTHIYTHYRDNDIFIYGDPSSQKNRLAGNSDFDILHSRGVYVQIPCTNNSVNLRHTAVKNVLKRYVNEELAMTISPACKVLLNGFKGDYKYKPLPSTQSEVTKMEVLKNICSHIHDALQYALLGAGEYEHIINGEDNTFRDREYNIPSKDFKTIKIDHSGDYFSDNYF